MTYALFQAALNEASGSAGLKTNDALRNLASVIQMNTLPTLEDMVLGSQSCDGGDRITPRALGRMAVHAKSISGVVPRLSKSGGTPESVIQQVGSVPGLAGPSHATPCDHVLSSIGWCHLAGQGWCWRVLHSSPCDPMPMSPRSTLVLPSPPTLVLPPTPI